MYQYNISEEPTSIFRGGRLPSLLWVYAMDDFPAWYHPMHVHEDSSLIVLIIDGENEITMNNQRFIGKKGDLLILNQGELMHERTHSEKPLNLISCAVQDVFLVGLPDNVVAPTVHSPLIQTDEYYNVLKKMMELILDECKQQSCGMENVCQNLIIAIITMIYRYLCGPEELCVKVATSDHEDYESADRIRKFVDQRFKENISLNIISKEFHFNPNYIVQIFKKKFGFSPIQYVIFRRIGEAQKLLLTTEMTVVDIANEVGYQNVNYFYMQFKKYKGISPNKYRQISRQNENLLE